ncbi:MAG: polysaccharide biosynthesis protein [Deltaproteobacteria bacterium]|nr:polysaccharide biosynthesis protein [Deltaproteobacteria bacterium]
MTKRLFDIAVAGVALLALLPVFAVVAILVKLSGPGPVFFRQLRLGRGGERFRIVKFRTMVADAPRLGPPITVAGDPRVTRLGALLRRYKIDEFPQLWNVLAGHMSLVGPRPEVPENLDLTSEEHQQMLAARPGITDYASLAYRDEGAVLAGSADPQRAYRERILPDKVRLSLLYLRRGSLVEDLRIIFATVYVTFQGLISRLGRPGQLAVDAAIAAVSFVLAFHLRFEFEIPLQHWKQMVLLLPYTVIARLAMNLVFGVYNVVWGYISLYDVRRFLKSVASVTLAFLAIRYLYRGTNPYYRMPVSVITLECMTTFLGIVGVRALRRWLNETVGANVVPVDESAGRVIVVGAGALGRALANEIRLHPRLNMVQIGFVDDDPAKLGTEIEGKRVLGRLADLARLHSSHGFSQAILAISGLHLAAKRRVLETCRKLDVKLVAVPGASDLISGRTQVSALRDLRIEDLLGRPVTNLTRDDPLLQAVYGDKSVLVTGAGGSIGSEICVQIAHLAPAVLVLFDKDENGLFVLAGELARRFPNLPVVVRVSDVRDREKVAGVLRALRPQVVIHAAAYKHVPLMEENPAAAVENNVLGTRNVVDVAVECGAETFVMLSTDKAVSPTSVMGATKRVAELIVRQAAERGGGTRCGSVRFGNVLGSRGSVVPLFRKQIERGGPVTVTHPEVTRFFMTIPEASQLVLKAGTLARKGEVFVLDMGQPVKIVDLAADLIRLSGFREDEVEIRFVGLRPGEKLYEELLVDGDSVIPTPVERVFVSKPELRDFAAISAQVDELLRGSRGADGAAIRAMLGRMGIGLREPDSGGEEAARSGRGRRDAPA